MKKTLHLASIVTFFAMTLSWAQAGPVADKAAEAEALAAEGKHVEAVLAMDGAISRLWDTLPLTFIEALFVNERPKGYGKFEPRGSNTFKAGEPMIFYMELAGFGYQKQDDQISISIKADVEVKRADGSLVGGQKDFETFSSSGRVPNRELFAVAIYEFTGLAPGDYTLHTTLRDEFSDRESTVNTPFSIN